MASIIQNKFHQLFGDLARPSKFVFILPPLTGERVLTDLIAYSVKSAVTPTISHDPIVYKHKGRTIPIRGQTKFSQSFSVTFYLMENHLNKRFFESWIALMEQRQFYYDPRDAEAKQNQIVFNQAGGETPPYQTFYNITCFLEQRDFDGDRPTAIYEIFNVFPTEVSAVSWDYSNIGAVQEFTVTFACSHFKLHSKSQATGRLPQQLYHSTHKGILEQKGSKFQRMQHEGASYTPYDNDYWYDFGRFDQLHNFSELYQNSKLTQEVYWRTFEQQRWFNDWNRWREQNGENKTNGSEIETTNNPEQLYPSNVDKGFVFTTYSKPQGKSAEVKVGPRNQNPNGYGNYKGS